MKDTINYIKKGIKIDRLTSELLDTVGIDSVNTLDKVIEISDLHTRELDNALEKYANEKVNSLMKSVSDDFDMSGDVTPEHEQLLVEMREMLIQYIENNI
jgi:hypothetical protein